MTLQVTAELGSTIVSRNSDGSIAFELQDHRVFTYTGADQVVIAGGAIVRLDGAVAVIAEAGAHVTAMRDSQVRAMPGSIVYAEVGAHVTAEENSLIHAYEGATVIALPGSIVNAYFGSHVLMHEGAILNQFGGANIVDSSGHLVLPFRSSPLTHNTYWGR